MKENILEALNYIPVSSLDYTDWIKIGQALKQEGYSCSDWEVWSRNDTRFKDGECQRKWNTFQGSANPVTGGTIIQMAKERGYVPHPFAGDGCMDWNDEIEFDGSGIEFEPMTNMTPTEQLIKYLETLYKPEELVSYVTDDVWQNKDGKWMPSKGAYDRTAGELIESLKKHPDDLGATIGDWKEECGAWIRFNPVNGNGIKNENITRFDYALVESDSLSIADQEAAYRRLELPIACLVMSGGKSLHAIVKVNAKDYNEYRMRVDFLYGFLAKNGIEIDTQNRNPSRLSRLPGVTRNGNEQTLIATDIGRKDWNEWLDYVEGMNDELPPLTYLGEALLEPIELPDQLITGVLRQGHKMILCGPSKAGKSFLLMELALAISSGSKWLNFDCKKGKVLYVNLEIDGKSFLNRFQKIMEARKMTVEDAQNITIWNLRGKALPMDKLVPKLIRRISKQDYIAVIIDPIYKVITGDENSASDMAQFCNEFDKICNETGCSTIYCHHHSKGTQGQKNIMDRGSGSGVFARDPDAIIDMTELELDKEFRAEHAATEHSSAWQIEGSLREFEPFLPVKCWFDYPIHRFDANNALEGKYPKGSWQANSSKSSKRKQSCELRKDDFDNAFDVCMNDEGSCSIDDLKDYLNVSARTIRSRVTEFSKEYVLANGKVLLKGTCQIGRKAKNS